jgi:hypothetical protein
MADTASFDQRSLFESELAQKESSFERAWLQLPHADLARMLAKLSVGISEGALQHGDAEGPRELGYLVQMTGVREFLRRSGVHADSALKPIEDNVCATAKLSEFRHDLAKAADLHRESGCQRLGTMSALKGVIGLSRALHGSFELLEPLGHVFDELQDLEERKKPGKLTTPDHTNENAEAGSAEWGLRASLWAVMEIRICMGERRSVAAARVCRDCRQAVDHLYLSGGRSTTPQRKLIGLRSEMRKGRYPKSANARVIVHTVEEQLSKVLQPAVEKGDSGSLERAYDGMLKEVSRYLNRLA